MAISFTIHKDTIKFKIPDRFEKQINSLFSRAAEKNGGYITVSFSLPRRKGTDEQNRAFHALLGEYYISNLHSFKCYEDMRDYFKILAGGAKEYLYLDIENGVMIQHTCKRLDDIPSGCVWAKIPKSWTEFSREERTLAIQLVITEGFNAGMNSDKWFEIIGGLEDGKI